jgi:hypothetical protein
LLGGGDGADFHSLGDVPVDECVAFEMARIGEQCNRDVRAAIGEMSRGGETVAAVVARTDEDEDFTDAISVEHFTCGIRDGAAGVFHQEDAGDAVFFNRAAIDFANLLTGEAEHVDSCGLKTIISRKHATQEHAMWRCTMNDQISRREMMVSSLAAGAAIGLMPRGTARGAEAASNKIVLAIAGVRTGSPGGSGRGIELINNFTPVPGVEFKYVIDVNRKSAGEAAGIVEKKQGKAPIAETDFRRALDDKDVDAILISTPDHWHAPMAILAVKAGKQVYVEKPCSHNPREGEMLVEAAAKYRRLVQLGTQRRSQANIREMVREIGDGIIGNVFLAQCFYSRRRPPIGFGKETAAPADFNWDLWQGPAPRTAYRDNVQPYNWHWFWRWGTGEAGIMRSTISTSHDGRWV